MNDRIQNTLTLIHENYQILKKLTFWETGGHANAVMDAMILASKNQLADAEKYKACKKLLKQHAAIFSEFRGLANSMVITKMMLSEDPENYLEGCMTVYRKLRDLHKWTASPFMVSAAITIYEKGGLSYADHNIEKLETLYKALKAEHPLLTTDSDRALLSLLSVSGYDMNRFSNEVEENYQKMKGISLNNDSVFSLAQVLVLSSLPLERKAADVRTLLESLRQYGHPINKEFGLSALGGMELLDIPVEEKVRMIIEVDDSLKGQEGFRWYDFSARQRRVFASLIVLMAESKEDRHIASTLASTMTITIVEEMVIAMIIACNSASAAAASSSSS